ncbi:helicase-related protein [Haloferula sp.]|uniref:helicase-related protein n=1 Tax=Haloferula sp. TaxID=2497595 RepID=UPI003C76FF9C
MPGTSPPTLQSSIFDNRSRGAAGDFLKQHIRDDSDLSFVSAYFTVHAYAALKTQLESADHLRFLFGEPTSVSSLDKDQKQARQFTLGPDGQSMELGNQLSQKQIARECAAWIRNKVEIRSITRSSFLHGKLYHIQNGESSHALLGSSNFTVPGLGLKTSGNNVELNIAADSRRDVEDLKAWFDELWTDSSVTTDVRDKVLAELDRLYSDNTPEFIYFLTLFHLFRHYLEDAGNLEDTLSRAALPDTGIWKALYSFQKDGAKAAINKILSTNGCILADSVGLGKTYTSLAVIKFFELRNERVLVLCPKKLRRNWTVYKSNSTLNPFDEDRFGYHVLSHTDLSRERGEVDGHDLSTFNWGAYDLVVIDESHNFRNNRIQTSTDPEEEVRRTRYQRLMEDIIQSGQKTKVLLLSATPVNNELADLRNQISFIAGGDVTREETANGAFSESLGISSVKDTTRVAQSHFTTWSKKRPEERTTKDLLLAIGGDFFKLLDGLSIARSRKQISTYYKEEMKRLGGFPKRPAPLAIHPPIDTTDKFISFEQLNEEISALKLALYHPTSYLREDLPADLKTAYEDKILGAFTQQGREKILVSMMKVNFLKRLESSVDSFRLTLERTIAKISDLEIRIAAFEAHAEEKDELDFDSVLPDQFEDPDLDPDLVKGFTIGGRRRIHLAHLDRDKWLQHVRHDLVQLRFLLDKTEKVTPERDAKLLRMRELIDAKISKPSINKDGKPVRKVLVFTAFADTAKYLYTQLQPHFHGEHGIHTALVVGDGDNKTTLGTADYDDILTNFSPMSKRRAEQPRFPQQEEIEILIATDCISEGQNLQDADLLVNYDIHWNPVRIIQRFGRIDRIGSRNESVQLVNFWPVADLDKYLNVKHRVEARMALADLSATQTDNLLEPDQLEDLITADLRFRDKQLKRLQNEVLDLEDLDDSPSLTSFSLDDFRIELLQFLESRRAELEEAPLGLYTVVRPPDNVRPAVQPGALFCLRRASQADQRSATGEKLNPLAPHFLLYVHDDGMVRYSFAQPKETLNLLRSLAAGHPNAFGSLCDQFDAATQGSSEMTHYADLVASALRTIEATFQKRATTSLLSGRDGLLPTSAETVHADDGDWELVTWLVVLNPS